MVYVGKRARAHGSEFEKLGEELMGKVHEEGNASAQETGPGRREEEHSRGTLENGMKT